jgi:hypothetical protein
MEPAGFAGIEKDRYTVDPRTETDVGTGPFPPGTACPDEGSRKKNTAARINKGTCRVVRIVIFLVRLGKWM